MIGALLIASAILLHATNWEQVREINLFALVLVVQSLPFLASVALAALEGTRANNLAAWRGLEARLVGWRPARAQGVSATVTVTVTALSETPVAADKRVEPAQ